MRRAAQSVQRFDDAQFSALSRSRSCSMKTAASKRAPTRRARAILARRPFSNETYPEPSAATELATATVRSVSPVATSFSEPDASAYSSQEVNT